MIRILVANDPHTADRPPLGRTESYCDDVLAKLEEIGLRAKELECQAVVISGDIFHIKRAPYVSHALIQRLIAIFRAYPCIVLVVPGNHDLAMEGLASIARQPLGVLARAGVITLLGIDGGHYQLAADKQQMLLIGRPYDIDGDADPDYYGLTDDELAFVKRWRMGRLRAVVMVAHGSIVPPKEKRPYPYCPANLIDFNEIDLLLSGHLHENMGLHEVRGSYFANFGSISRVSRTADNYKREVVALLVTLTDDNAFKFAEVPIDSARPAEDIFVEGPDASEPDTFGAGDFAEHIMAALNVEEMSIEELIASYASDVPEPIKRRLGHYLALAGL